MKKQLILIDFMYLVHRHLFNIKTQEERLGHPLMTNPKTGEESARLYFVIKDIEQIFQKYPNADICVCSDRPSLRKQLDTSLDGYKSNRSPNRFDDLAKAAIKNTLELLAHAGVSVIYADNYEADDLIASIVQQYCHEYDILIYTPDSDLAALVSPSVYLMRYKAVYSKRNTFINAHYCVTPENYEAYFSEEYSKKGKVTIAYNSLMLYKVLVGDFSDNIKGVKGFGNAAYDKLCVKLLEQGQIHRLYSLNTEASIIDFLTFCVQNSYLNATQLNQALEALALVKPYTLEIPRNVLYTPANFDTRKFVYYDMWGISKI